MFVKVGYDQEVYSPRFSSSLPCPTLPPPSAPVYSMDQIQEKIKQVRVYFYHRFGMSIGSARFWFPGSGTAKICGFTFPDSKGLNKYQPITAKKTRLLLKLKSELLKKERL